MTTNTPEDRSWQSHILAAIAADADPPRPVRKEKDGDKEVTRVSCARCCRYTVVTEGRCERCGGSLKATGEAA